MIDDDGSIVTVLTPLMTGDIKSIQASPERSPTQYSAHCLSSVCLGSNSAQTDGRGRKDSFLSPEGRCHSLHSLLHIFT